MGKKTKQTDELMVFYGGAIKAVGDGVIEGWLVKHTGQDDLDLEGDYFGEHDGEFTDYHNPTDTIKTNVYYAHGQDPNLKLRRLGKEQGTLDISDEVGAWIKVQLDLRDEYEQAIYDMAQKDKLGWSSGAPIHLVERVELEEGYWIKSWPLGSDASITPQPAAGLKATRIMTLKEWQGQTNLKALDLEAAQDTATDSATVQEAQAKENKSKQEPKKMSEKELDQTVAKAVTAALKEQREAAEAQAEKDKEVADAIKDGIKAGIAEANKDQKVTNDPGFSSPYVAQFSDQWKYDNYPAGDLAGALHFVDAAKTRSSTEVSESLRQRPAMVKALALRLESKEADDVSKRTGMTGKDIEMPGPLKTASRMMKQSGVKVAEMDTSIASNFGDEWVGVAYGAQVWDEVRNQSQIVQRVPSLAFPSGAESLVIPISGGDVPWYTITQATAPGATSRISYTVPQQGVGTDNVTMTLGVLGTSSLYTGMLVEDSVVPFVSELRASITLGGADYLTSALIDGDTTAANGLNDFIGTASLKEWFLIWDGFRHSCLVDNTGNGRSGGTLSTSDFLETVKLMGPAGKVGFDRNAVSFIIDPNVHWKSLELADVKTKDVFTGATLEGGMLSRIYNYEVIPSYQINFSSTVNGAYAYKTLSTGFVDIDTDSNNTKGVILAVRWDKWKLGYRRQVTSEVERIPRADSWEITSLLRVGLVQRDSEASAITYNLTV